MFIVLVGLLDSSLAGSTLLFVILALPTPEDHAFIVEVGDYFALYMSCLL